MANVKDMNFGHLGAAINGITNVETLAVTSNAIIMPNPTAHILVSGSVQITIGAAAGTITVKIYRGASLSGTLVYTSDAIAGVAAGKVAIPFHFQEDLANAAGAQYTVSVTHSTNQAGNNIDFADIQVVVL